MPLNNRLRKFVTLAGGIIVPGAAGRHVMKASHVAERRHRGRAYGSLQATTCGSPLRPPVTGPPAGAITVLPTIAIGELVDVGS